MDVIAQDSDKIVHGILGNEAFEEVRKHFPAAIANGVIDRRKLGSIVFSDDAKLKLLESIIHPHVRKKNLDFIEQNKNRICLVEIPLLFETNAEEIFDYVVYVDVNAETQKERALQRQNFSADKLEQVLERQHKIPPEEKKRRADFVIDNNPGADTVGQIKNILEQICAK